MQRNFKRIAVVNRGEAAMRLIRAVKEINTEQDAGLRSIALYTDPDRRALFVREADEAYYLGTATFVDDRDGRTKNRYLDYAGLARALQETRAEAVWVGWGFVSEHAEFAELCRSMGVVFIGPSPEVMRSLGDKISSKRMAEQSQVPVAPWSGGPVESLAAAEQQAQQLGFPLMIKATAGGGGRGIRRVNCTEALAEAYASARAEAHKSFGDDTVFMEQLLEGARHIEVQIIGDDHGKVWALGVRDCSVQRRNQKVLEESPSPVLSTEQHEEICAAARQLGETAGYCNAGTVEFLYDPVQRLFSFMEVNARLQVEHPVTEVTTGIDLVKLQLRVAAGARLEGDPPVPRGHAIEVRLYAEDAEHGFTPTPGQVVLFTLPGGPGIRIDSGFVEGDHIAPEFDSMLAKLIAGGANRGEALARLKRALLEMRLIVRCGTTNKGFLIGLLDRPEVRSGEYDIGWLDQLAARGEHLSWQHADIAIVQSAIEAYRAEFKLEQARFYATAARGRLRLSKDVGCEVELRYRGSVYCCKVFRTAQDYYRVDIDGASVHARLEQLGGLEHRLTLGDARYKVLSLLDGRDHKVVVNGVPHRMERDEGGVVRAPAPAVVLALEVEEGQEVTQGQRVALLEAMKTEIPVLAPCAGKIHDIGVTLHVQVDVGAPLMLVQPQRQVPQQQTTAERVSFAAYDQKNAIAAGTTDQALCDTVEQLRREMLGYDVEPTESGRALESYRSATASTDCLQQENEILGIFADICALFSPREEGEDTPELQARTQEEYLLLYLRSLDTETAGVTSIFTKNLRRSLKHYGVKSLQRSAPLEAALLWICKSHQRMPSQVQIVLSILEKRLDRIDELQAQVDDYFRLLLDRIVLVTRRRYTGLSDLAREVRYRYFYRPVFMQTWEHSLAQVDAQLNRLAQSGEEEMYAQAAHDLVDCPLLLSGLLGSYYEEASPRLRQFMLEVLLRRNYRQRELLALLSTTEDGSTLAQATYEQAQRRIQLIASCGSWDELASCVSGVRSRLDSAPADHDIVIDIYLWRTSTDLDEDQLAKEVLNTLVSTDFPRPLRRVVVAIGDPDSRFGSRGIHHFTFRQREQEFYEERVYRGLHPMTGKRLELWRLQNFEIQRLPSAEGVYLFHGVARSNAKDERLFAFAEIRDLTPLVNEADNSVRLPHVEVMLMETLAAIRLVQMHRAARARLHWNRVTLYVWPTVEYQPRQMLASMQRLPPLVEGLGLEKIVFIGRMRTAPGEVRDSALQVEIAEGQEPVLSFKQPSTKLLEPLSEYAQKVVRMRKRGMVYPYEIIAMLTPPREGTQADFPPGEFLEYDLDSNNQLVAIKRPPGENTANIVVGLITNFTDKYPEGMQRVLLMGDPSGAMGSLAEPECRLIMAALQLAQQKSLPVDWFALSAGAKIAMDSGTENMDWIAVVMRGLIEFTQAAGEVNIIVDGVNVGAQSYWNAEATMLMHTRGILVMTPNGSMLLTGKRALDYAGSVSAEDSQGIGGYDKIMGANGQAQYWARDIGDACHTLLRYYEHSYVVPGERFPRRAATSDAVARDVGDFPHADRDLYGFDTVGEIMADATNPGRHRPFDIRNVMTAVIDQDHAPLERWRDWREGETGVVWDAHLGGYPLTLLGIESHPIARLGFVPTDGSDRFTPSTLFPMSSKKIARAVNAASGNRPVVVLANLSGFDGSPESMRRLQLEFGAEIARAVVNFKGPMVFCGICRYHGGAYVVFSKALNDNMHVAALDGSYASVIGGKPAAAVVFSAKVDARTHADPRLQQLEEEIAAADEAMRGRLRARWHELYELVHAEKLGEVAAEFDAIHSVQRALEVGSLHKIVPPGELRPYLIAAVEKGMRKELQTTQAATTATRPAAEPA